jgi:HEAT repeat protein
MTLNRLMILVGILVLLAGGGIAWLWEYAYSPQGRARVIIAQLKGDESTLRGWMLKHHVIRPGYGELTEDESYRGRRWYCGIGDPEIDDETSRVLDDTAAASDAMVKLGREVLPIAIGALQDNNHDVRLTAILACGKFHDPSAIQPLVKCTRGTLHQNDYALQFGCLISLVEIGPAASGPLLELTKEKECDSDVLKQLPAALAKKWGVAAVPNLIELIDCDDTDDTDYSDVRSYAVEEIGKLHDQRAIPVLIRHLSDSNPYVRQNAAEALHEIGGPKAISALLKTLKDTQVEGTALLWAAGALAWMGQDEGLKFLLAQLKFDDVNVRADVARVLGFRPFPGALESLIYVLKDKDNWVRCVAIEAIGELRDKRAIPTVRALLDDHDADVRRHAVDAMNKLGVTLQPASQPASNP